MRRGAKPKKTRAAAKRTGTGKARKDAASRIRDLEKRLAEALDQEMASAEILRIISSSPTDVQPVLDEVLEKAVRVCQADLGLLFRYETDAYRLAAFQGARPEFVAFFSRGPITPSPDTGLGRILTTRRAVQIDDVTAEDLYRRGDPLRRATADLEGIRTWLGVPMIKDGDLIGAIVIYRREVRRFADSQVRALLTFADQAVIAIENVRLFTELQEKNRALTRAHAQVSEALEQQTATAEILRVISRSPTDVQPVFDAVAANAARLCSVDDVTIHRVENGGLRRVAHVGSVPVFADSRLPLLPGGVNERVLSERRTVHIPDTHAPSFVGQFPGSQHAAMGIRSLLATPLVRDGVAIGLIQLRRSEAWPFTDKQIALLETFADQAVIAIENVRLFNETKEALDRQTATSEILRVISRSPTDVQPVFDAIVQSATTLCDAAFGAAFRFDGQLVMFAAHHNATPSELEILLKLYPQAATRGRATGRAIIDRRIIHIPDIREDPEYSSPVRQALGWRTVLAVPMLRDGEPIGALGLWRREVRAFTDKQIELVSTFADQAVIAIENVRLFKELQARTAELTRSVGELRALSDVGQTISSTLDLEAVLRTIVGRATQLAGMDAGVIYEYDEAREVFVPRATERLDDDLVQMLVETPVRKGQGATGRLAEIAEPVQLADFRDTSEQVAIRDAFARAGYRALLAVPLVRENHLIGGLTVFRKATGAFEPEVVDLLRTFATQSALAIQNARLFREIADKSRQLEAASRHKSEFLANMSHELRTPLNAIIGFSEVLTERMFGELNEKQEEYLKDIYASGQHLLSLINDILDLSKIEAGRMELELRDFDLPQAIGNAVTLVRERAGRRRIALHQTVDQGLGQIRADERKIKQVLLNLLSNALKFTPEGGRVDVLATVADDMAEVSVTDTGVGIAPEDQEAVFEEFRQIGTADKKVEGTGLGLALSRKFIELHGGRIWVQSEMGRGSTFTFTLPLTMDHQREASG